MTTDVDALNDLFAAGVVTMINDFFLLAVLAGVAVLYRSRLALDALAVLPFILVVTFFFRKLRARREPAHSHRDRQHQLRYLQEYISGMSVVQLFNREQKARAEFSQPQPRKYAGLA